MSPSLLQLAKLAPAPCAAMIPPPITFAATRLFIVCVKLLHGAETEPQHAASIPAASLA